MQWFSTVYQFILRRLYFPNHAFILQATLQFQYQPNENFKTSTILLSWTITVKLILFWFFMCSCSAWEMYNTNASSVMFKQCTEKSSFTSCFIVVLTFLFCLHSLMLVLILNLKVSCVLLLCLQSSPKHIVRILEA